MDKKLIAKASTTIQAPVAKVWGALVNPATIKQYMFGTNVVSDWKKGSPITWKGEWEGKKYEDKGVILDVQPQRKLAYTHFSRCPAFPNAEIFRTVTIGSPKGTQTLVSLSQDNNANEKEREHSQKNWEMMLSGLKKLLES